MKPPRKSFNVYCEITFALSVAKRPPPGGIELWVVSTQLDLQIDFV